MSLLTSAGRIKSDRLSVNILTSQTAATVLGSRRRASPRADAATHSLPASIRHVATDWAIHTGRRSHPTFEDTMSDPHTEEQREIEGLVRSRAWLRYSDWLQPSSAETR